MKSIALIGFMGSGKSTIGPLVADALGEPFVDLDNVVTEAAGMTVADVFAREGEAGWRRRERSELLRLAGRDRRVLGCGGGVILDPANRAVLKDNFITVYLRTSPEALLKRLRGATGRPLLDVDRSEDALRQLYGEREPIYENAADVTVLTDNKAPELLAREIVKAIEDASGNG